MPRNPDDPTPQPAHIIRLRDQLGAEWPFITRARERAEEAVARIHQQVSSITPPDTSLVVFGSVARGEVTTGSDVDWTLLVDAYADPFHQESAQRIRARLKELEFTSPSAGGPFGSLTFSHDLIHRIGGDDDTNRNTTQRLLLLLESRPIGAAGAYERVIEHVLGRYIEEDLVGPGDNPYRVPRFLQNDVVRYWRTMAVDFAHKRRVRGAKGWALRTAKLRMSRKLMYAAGLLSCFSCEFDVWEKRAVQPFAASQQVVSHLTELVRTTPLDIVAWVVLHFFGELSGTAHDLFGSYDDFLGLLDSSRRDHLAGLSPDAAGEDAVYKEVREIGQRFQDALTRMFFESDTPLPELTKRYGVF
jgi:predicted nucleotidyltransferase